MKTYAETYVETFVGLCCVVFTSILQGEVSYLELCEIMDSFQAADIRKMLVMLRLELRDSLQWVSRGMFCILLLFFGTGPIFI